MHRPNAGGDQGNRANGRARAWTVTIFPQDDQLGAFDQDDVECRSALKHTLESIKERSSGGLRYGVLGREYCPDSRRLHLQGFLYFSAARSFNSIRLLVLGERFQGHLERARASAQENREYCIKDGCFDEIGDLPAQGHRSDIDALIDGVRGSLSERQLWESHGPVMLRFWRGVLRFRDVLRTRRTFWTNIIWIFGPSGTGKTTFAITDSSVLGATATGPGVPYCLYDHSGTWWDYYDSEKCVLIDDLCPGELPVARLLQYANCTAITVPTKGGSTPFNGRYIYITSNYRLRDCFPGISNQHQIAIARRIDEYWTFDIDGTRGCRQLRREFETDRAGFLDAIQEL